MLPWCGQQLHPTGSLGHFSMWVLGEEQPGFCFCLLHGTPTKYKRQEEQHPCFHWLAYRVWWSEASYHFCWHSWKQNDDSSYCFCFILFFVLLFFWGGEWVVLNKTDCSEMQFYNNPETQIKLKSKISQFIWQIFFYLFHVLSFAFGV